MTINDIATLACNECGDSSAEMLSYLLKQIPFRYEIMYNAHPWQEAMVQPHYEFASQPAIPIPSPSQSFWMPQILPLQHDRVMWAKFSQDSGISFPYDLEPRERHWIERNDESAFITTTGQMYPKYYFHGQPVGFPLYSPGLLTFTPLSSASAVQVTIEGRDSTGLEQVETLTLNGTTPIATANNYAEVHNIAKNATGGPPITVSASAGNTVFGAPSITIQPQDENVRYTVMVVWPAYNGTPTLNLRVASKLKIDPLSSPNSIPRVTSLHTALYYYARSAVLGKQKQWDLAAADMQTSQKIFSDLVQAEMASQGAFQQVVPKIFDDPNDVWNSFTAWGQ
jgi:hypothetical protein